MTQEQANWEWIDARVKKLEEHCFSAKTLTEKQIEAIKTLYYNRGHEDGRNIALPAKTLTDEEIEEAIDEIIDAMGFSLSFSCARRNNYDQGIKKFREILEKNL